MERFGVTDLVVLLPPGGQASVEGANIYWNARFFEYETEPDLLEVHSCATEFGRFRGRLCDRPSGIAAKIK